MKFLVSLLVVPSLLLATPQANAATYLGEEVLVVQNPISNDVYAAGNKVVFQERVNGDLVTAGADITISNRVDEDIMAAGGKVRIRGTVGDDVRVAGGDIEIGQSVTGDVIVFGGSVEILDGVTIGGDLVVTGGEVHLAGIVRGRTIVNAGVLYMTGTTSDVDFQGGTLHLGGVINGNLQSVSEDIVVSSSTTVSGNVEYWSNQGEVALEDVVSGTVTFTEELRPYSERQVRSAKAGLAGLLAAVFAGGILFSLLSTLLVIIVFVFMTKSYFNDAVKVLKKEPWMNALYGLLYFVVTPILAALLFVTVIGIPLGAALLALYIVTVLFAKPMSAILLVKYWEVLRKPKVKKKLKPLTNWQVVFLSLGVYVLLKIVGAIPLLGWIVVTVAVCAAYGAYMRTEYQKFLKVR